MIFTTYGSIAAPLGVSSGVSSGISSDMTVGAVHQSKGETFARNNTISVAYAKNKGDMVGAGEILSTGKNSSMTVKFMDSTIMTLGSDAEVEVDELVFDPKGNAKDNHIIISLAQGTYYYVSGKIKKENVTILTPTAAIGIRGTELAISVDRDGATSVGVVKGAAIMRARRRDSDRDRSYDGGVYIDLGSTGRIEKSGKISKPFGGVDLTGDEEIDRKIPGVAEWLDHDEEHEGEELASNEHNIESDDDDDDDHSLRGEKYDDENHEVKDEEEDHDKDYDTAENERSRSDDDDDGDDSDNDDSDDDSDNDDSDDGDNDDSDDDGDDDREQRHSERESRDSDHKDS